MRPTLCGYDYDEDSFSIGILYCLMYYAATNTKAKSNKAVEMNHMLAKYKEIVYQEIDYELSRQEEIK